MADKRIIDLTAAGSFGLTDVLEIDTGTLSLKVTGQQVYNLIAATLNAASPLTLGGGNIVLSNDGSGSLAGLAITFDSGGNISVANLSCAEADVGGDAVFSSNTLGPVLLSRPTNTRYRLVVDDNGNLGTEAA